MSIMSIHTCQLDVFLFFYCLNGGGGGKGLGVAVLPLSSCVLPVATATTRWIKQCIAHLAIAQLAILKVTKNLCSNHAKSLILSVTKPLCKILNILCLTKMNAKHQKIILRLNTKELVKSLGNKNPSSSLTGYLWLCRLLLHVLVLTSPAVVITFPEILHFILWCKGICADLLCKTILPGMILCETEHSEIGNLTSCPFPVGKNPCLS